MEQAPCWEAYSGPAEIPDDFQVKMKWKVNYIFIW
jgi:hypothetical protein